MTRSEQEIFVRSVERRCRGLCLSTDDSQRENFAEWYKISATKDWDSAVEFLLRIEKSIREYMAQTFPDRSLPILSISEVERDDWVRLQEIIFKFIRPRGDEIGLGCGWDLNDEITQHPFDGMERKYECPNCGNKGTYRSPIFYD